VLNALKKDHPLEAKIKFHKEKRVFNNKKVEGHSAIIPTYMIPKAGTLSKDEEIVYKEVVERFLIQFMPVMEYEETVVKIQVDGAVGLFIAKGKVITEKGFKELLKTETKEETLPLLCNGAMLDIIETTVSKGKTKPPVPHTEKTLLRVMETCGKQFADEDSEELMSAVLAGFSIGTPATRAETIKKLKTAGYIEAKGKNLSCSSLGAALVETFPVQELLDLDYTGKLEKSLSDIEKGKMESSKLLTHINEFVINAVKNIKENGGIKVEEINNTQEVLGSCPECGGDVVENGKAFGCSGYKNGCKFAIWKNDRFLESLQKKPTKTMVKDLLGPKKSAEVKGLISKKGNKFDAILSYKKNPETGYYNWEMKFPEK
jgi:DNA topoisomerase-3